MNYIDCDSLPRPYSYSEGCTGIYPPSYLTSEGYYFLPEGETSPHCCVQGPEKQYTNDEVWKQDEDNWLRRENICDNTYQETLSSQEHVNAYHCRCLSKRHQYKHWMCHKQ